MPRTGCPLFSAGPRAEDRPPSLGEIRERFSLERIEFGQVDFDRPARAVGVRPPGEQGDRLGHDTARGEPRGDHRLVGGQRDHHFSRAFRRLARMGRAHLEIKPGLYDLHPNTPIGQVLVTLRRGRDPVRRVIFPKGSWLSEVAALVERDMGIEPEIFLAAAGSESLLFRLGARGTSVEGYLYPSVYYLRVGASADETVNQFAETFEGRWNPEWDDRVNSAPDG